MNLILNPEYKNLEAFLNRLPESFDRAGKTIYKSRNEIKIFEMEDLVLNVKSYKIPIFINRLVYTFFRKSKARRAYENALEVLALGFDTPRPVAYMELKKCGLLEKSYFASLQCPHSRMMREFADYSDVIGREDILQALGVYVAALHEVGILHLDLSTGNILFEKSETGVHFSLIDINRMKFCPIDQDLGCKNFERLRGSDDFFKVVADSYAKARGFDAEHCLETIMHYNVESRKHFDRKRALKKRLGR